MFSALLIGAITAGISVLALKNKVEAQSRDLVKCFETVEKASAALIFGAYVDPYGTPCPVLQDRLQTGFELYRQGLVAKLILSGDHGQEGYDEVGAMRVFLENKGVAKPDLFLDHGGLDTFDSLYRAREMFQARNLILVTQSFHLKRALFIGRSLGLDVQGVAADRRRIPEIRSLERRELAANFKAVFDLKSGFKAVYSGPRLSLDADGTLTHAGNWDGTSR